MNFAAGGFENAALFEQHHAVDFQLVTVGHGCANRVYHRLKLGLDRNSGLVFALDFLHDDQLLVAVNIYR
ncbi:MAG: hypothetical protein AAFX40_20020, partial [Cyanobacteria bacterium J06639_1]